MPHDAAVTVPPLDLTRPRRVHIVGIGGVGMSAIALLLARMGHTVSGSDLKESVALSRLEACRALAAPLDQLPYRPVVKVGENLDDTWHMPVADVVRDPVRPKDGRRRA